MKRCAGFFRRQVKARPLACFSVAFLAGLIIALKWRFSTPACAAVCAGFLAATIALRIGRRRVFAWAMLGFALFAGMTRQSLARGAVPDVETRYSVSMTGRIVSEPYTNPDTGRVISVFRLESIDGAESRMRVRLYLRGDPEMLSRIDYGQRLSFTGHLWACDPVTNPWQFDFGQFLRRDGLAAYATAKIEEVTVEPAAANAKSAVIRLRRSIADRIDALFPDGAGMVRALILGDRSLLSEETREALNRTGTAHLISISGLHVTLLAALLSTLLGLAMPRRRANALTLLFLIPYGVLIGFGAPFFRALVMFAVFSFAPIAGLPSDSVTRLSAAMLVYLSIRPMDVNDAGFVLSYSASAGLLLLMPPLSDLTGLRKLKARKPPAKRGKRMIRAAALYLPTLFCASLAAQLATLPAVIAYFGVQPILSLPFNLVCVPLCMLGYLGALAALALSIVSMPLAAVFARAPEAVFRLLFTITRWSARLPQTGVRIGRYPVPLVLAHAAIIVAASELSRIRLRWRRIIPFALIIVAGASSLWSLARAWPFSIVFLDAGQADCAVVRSRGHTYLMDAGDTYTPAADYLSATCLHLDGIVLSHPHQDHAGGLKDVLTAFRPDVIYVPAGWFRAEEVSDAVTEGFELASALDVPIVELSAGDVVSLSDAARMTVYAPDGSFEPNGANDMSIMALVECDGNAALFTGDLSQQGEPAIIPDADILKVAHHGSDKATSQRFIEACTPEIAVISVGENNFGHPSEDTLKRLSDAGARIYETRRCGAITLTRRGGSWNVDTYLEAADELE